MTTRGRLAGGWRGRRHGLSMVEALISLAVCSLLLVAAGTAFTAAAKAVQINSDFYKSAQTARVAMGQMAAEVRQADSVTCAASGATYVDVIRPTATLTANEVYRRYAYNSTNKQLTLTIYYSGGTSSPTYVMASGVTAAAFGPPQSGLDSQGQTVVQRLPLSITVTVGKNVLTLSGSGSPRRAVPA